MSKEEEFVSKKTGVQFVKFAIVGLINTGVDWGAFFLLSLVPFFASTEWLAKALAFVLAASNSFLMNSFWTFKSEFREGMEEAEKGEERMTEGTKYYLKFMVVSVIGLTLNTLIFSFSRSYILGSWSTRLSQLGSLVLASGAVMIWNFLANKFWTYKIATDFDHRSHR